jgi:hypothetical protein
MEVIEKILEETVIQPDNTDDVVAIVESFRHEGVEAEEIGRRLSLLNFDPNKASEEEAIKTAKRLENPKITGDQLDAWYRKTYGSDDDFDDDEEAKTVNQLKRQEAVSKAVEFIESKRPKRDKVEVNEWQGVMGKVLPTFRDITHEIKTGDVVERVIKVEIPESDMQVLSQVAEEYLKTNKKARTKESVMEAVDFAHGLYMANNWKTVVEKNIRDVSADIEERVRKEYANTGSPYRPMTLPEREKLKSDMDALKRQYLTR